MALRRKFTTISILLFAMLQLQISEALPRVNPQTSSLRLISAGKRNNAIGKLPQEQQREPLGSLSSVGEVYVNESRAPSEATVFAGDKIRTGESGTATFTESGRGFLEISPNTRLTFGDDPRYVVALDEGKVVMSVIAEAAKFEVRTGEFVVVPGPETPEASSEIDRSADGSFRILCKTGSVGVIALETAEGVFLRPDQSVTISAEGILQAVVSPPTAPNPSTSAAPVGHKRRTEWIILGAAGAGGGAAAAVLLTRKSTVSPSSP
jgi:ferric-dicitrate binding protein FerR (iron transport regulator)